jgi:hypothetical protein
MHLSDAAQRALDLSFSETMDRRTRFIAIKQPDGTFTIYNPKTNQVRGIYIRNLDAIKVIRRIQLGEIKW